MEWLQADPLPTHCQKCPEDDCWECDNACDRWYIPHNEELRIKKKSLEHQIEKLQRQIQDIESELLPFTDQQQQAIDHKIPMSQDLFLECLDVCLKGKDSEMISALCSLFPECCNSEAAEKISKSENWESFVKSLSQV